MQRINCPGCYCSTPTPDLCAVYTVRFCTPLSAYTSSGGWIVPAGVVVRIRASSGGAIVDEGVTDSSGQVTLCVPTSATRWIEVEFGSYIVYGFSGTTNATNRGIGVSSFDLTGAGWCCPQAGVCETGTIRLRPRDLYVTDANGTWAFSGGIPCGVVRADATGVVPLRDSRALTTDPCVAGPGSINYWYQLNGLNISRQWWRGLGGAPAGVGSCESTLGYASATMTPFACPDVYWSGGLSVPVGGPPDPIGGTVVVSN